MIQHMIVVREVIAGNDVYAGIFLNLPMLKPKALALIQELFL